MRYLLLTALFVCTQAKLDVAPRKLSMIPGDFYLENVKEIMLMNSNPNSHVAFKIQIFIHGVLNDRRFSVNPAKGIILPGASFVVKIRLHDGLPVSGFLSVFDEVLTFPIQVATIDYNFEHYRSAFTETIVEIEGKPQQEARDLLKYLDYEILGTAGNNEETSVRSHYGPNGAGALSIYQNENWPTPLYHNYILLDSSELPTNADGSINEKEVTYEQFDRSQLYHGKGIGSRPHSHLKNARNELNDENLYPIRFPTASFPILTIRH
ncbi:hypothetical protein Ddc_12632 [Ditylenchus destructor]|nr:hypothetical protein Ddc_12632 [Ditylenchus destructor]